MKFFIYSLVLASVPLMTHNVFSQDEVLANQNPALQPENPSTAPPSPEIPKNNTPPQALNKKQDKKEAPPAIKKEAPAETIPVHAPAPAPAPTLPAYVAPQPFPPIPAAPQPAPVQHPTASGTIGAAPHYHHAPPSPTAVLPQQNEKAHVSQEQFSHYGTSASSKKRNHRLSLNGFIYPYFSDDVTSFLDASLAVDYGYNLGSIEIGPFIILDFTLDYEKGLQFYSDDSDVIFGAFAEFFFIKNTTDHSFVPAIGLEVGYGLIDDRERSFWLSPYFDMKFFVTPLTALSVDVKLFWIRAWDDRSYDYGVGSHFGFVHYFQ